MAIKYYLTNVLNKTFLHKYLMIRFFNKHKNETIVQKVQNILADSSSFRVRITYDLSESPETHADIMGALMLARFYGSIGKQVEFIWLHSELNPKGVLYNQIQKNRPQYIDNQRELIHNVLSSFNNILIYESIPNSRTDIHLNDISMSINRPLYQVAELILNESAKFILKTQSQIPENFFLDFKVVKSTNFIAINFRFSEIESRRNPDLSSLLRDISMIHKYFPNSKIVIFSDPIGMTYVYKNLFELSFPKKINFRDIIIEPQLSNNYSDAFNEILKCKFFFMRKGGGMAIPIYYSTIPYLVVDNDFGGILSRRGNKNFCFSTDKQSIVRISRRSKLNRFLESLA